MMDYMPMEMTGKPGELADVRVLFFGMTGILSRIPLAILLNGGVNVRGIAIPASVLPPYVLPTHGRTSLTPSSPHLITPSPHHPGILELAAHYHLPVYPVGRLKDAETVAMLTAVAPDLICVSCFNQILPPSLLALPRLGCLNLHPSHLPHFRGPSPLFWVFREGQNKTAVTVHFMDAGIDTGDIALQASLTFPDGISGAQAEQMMAERGGRLLLEAIRQLAHGRLSRHPQSAPGSYYSAPTADDFRLEVNWSAQRAFNFMRGTAEWARPYPLTIAGQELVLRTAVSVDPAQTLAEPMRWHGRTISIQFSPGVLVAAV
jgi:methionyl-tRNA formyltransferase